MGVRIHISMFGDEQFSREITRVSDRAGNMDPAFRSIFDRMMEINSEQFRSQGSRGGAPWEELKPATILAKARAGLDPDIEFATHDLFEAMSSPSSPNNEMTFNETWAHFMVTGDPAEYGAIQHHGTLDGSLPARPLFVLTDQDRREFVREMERYLFTGEVGGFMS